MRYLTITQADIDAALQKCCGSESIDYAIIRDCPIGVALRREFSVGREEVSANAEFLRVGHYRSGHKYRVSISIRRFMRRFDKQRKATPCRFQLEEY